MTVVTDFTAILAIQNDNPNARWNAPAALGFPVFVSYTFLDADELPPVSSLAYSAGGVHAFLETFRQGFRDAAAEFEKVTGVRFVETDGPAMISAHGVTGSAWAGWASYPYVTGTHTGSGELVMDFDNTADGTSLSASGFETFLHELGHSMGLSHPHSGPNTLAAHLDTTATTVMSYNRGRDSQTTLPAMDVEALQHVYGGPVDLSGWTYKVEGGVFTLRAGDGDDRVMGLSTRNDLKGAGGDDTIYGRQEADILNGGKGNDTLSGLGGKDTILGGGGNDRLFAAGANSSDYTGNTLKGGAGRDVLIGSNGGDRLLGGGGNDRLSASRAAETDYSANTLLGGNGNDRLTGGKGDDILAGGKGHDILRGGSGWDVLSGGGGRDVMIGGAFRDRDTFAFSKADIGKRDVIRDFELGIDMLDLTATGFDLADVRIGPANGGANAILRVEGAPGFAVKLIGQDAGEMRTYVDAYSWDVFV